MTYETLHTLKGWMKDNDLIIPNRMIVPFFPIHMLLQQSVTIHKHVH